MAPLLVGMADIVILGGLIVAMSTSMINIISYMNSASIMLSVFDIVSGLIKAVVFAGIISTVATYLGLKVKYGAQDVGKKTQHTVVVSLISIFIVNYIMSVLFFT